MINAMTKELGTRNRGLSFDEDATEEIPQANRQMPYTKRGWQGDPWRMVNRAVVEPRATLKPIL